MIDLDSEINIIYLIFVKKTRLRSPKNKYKTQKIDSSLLKIYDIVIIVFLAKNKI